MSSLARKLAPFSSAVPDSSEAVRYTGRPLFHSFAWLRFPSADARSVGYVLPQFLKSSEVMMPHVPYGLL